MPADVTVKAFVEAFAVLGYSECLDGTLEAGFEKLVLYVEDGDVPSHMARQLPSGTWTSKCGDLEDIEHPTPECMCGPEPAYGRVRLFLRRPTPSA
jgi:hypothetical protein